MQVQTDGVQAPGIPLVGASGLTTLQPQELAEAAEGYGVGPQKLFAALPEFLEDGYPLPFFPATPSLFSLIS